MKPESDDANGNGEAAGVGVPTLPLRVDRTDGEAPAADVPSVQAPRLARAQPLEAEWHVKPGLPDNPKVAHLADRLGIDEAHALGILVRLWDRVGTTCDTGILRGWTARDFARQVAWRGDAEALLAGLHEERWLDLSEREAGLYIIHDWPEESPRHVALKWVRSLGIPDGRGAERAARDKMREIHDAAISDRSPIDRWTSNDRSPIPSVRIGSDRIGTDLDGSDPSVLTHGEAPKRNQYPPGFLAAWKAYPHHGTRSSKGQAGKLWAAQKLEPQVDAVLRWIEAGKASRDWTKDGGQYVPGMQVWLRGRDFSEPPPAQIVAPSRDVEGNARRALGRSEGTWCECMHGTQYHARGGGRCMATGCPCKSFSAATVEAAR